MVNEKHVYFRKITILVVRDIVKEFYLNYVVVGMSSVFASDRVTVFVSDKWNINGRTQCGWQRRRTLGANPDLSNVEVRNTLRQIAQGWGLIQTTRVTIGKN